MPLVRVQVRNEYGLGQPELYREANREDPKALLDGVAVAGLVGILRQLGDLAEFAAEVFHGLQEQVMSTSSRSHKLTIRVQHIEAALPPLEKAMLAQKSHLHFAYTVGSDWHAHLQNEQNHFIDGDLPQFIMDSYEECRDPPRLHFLDKFDTGGPGSCLKRYSDPTFFRRASANSGEANVEKVSKDKKAHRSKVCLKKRIRQQNEVCRGASISNHSDRTQLASLKDDERISPSETVSAFDGKQKSDLRDQSNSFDSMTGSAYIECVFHPTYSMKPEEREPKDSSFSSLRMQHNDILDGHSRVVDDDFPSSISQEQTGPSSSCVTWDEKTEIVESMCHQYDHDETSEMITMNCDSDTQNCNETAEMLAMNCEGDTREKGAINFRNVDQMDFQFDNEDMPTSISSQNQLDDIESEPDSYMDALNTIELESETDLDCQTKREVKQSSNCIDDRTQDGMHGLMAHHSDLQPSNLQSHTAAYGSLNTVVSFDKPNSISSEFYTHEEFPQMAGESSTVGQSLGVDFCGSHYILDGSNVEYDVRNVPSSGSAEPDPQLPLNDKIISTSSESQNSPIEPSGNQSFKLWTNGGLLGLEPSKPPDFSVMNAVSQDSVARSKDDITSPASQNNTLNGNGDVRKPDKLVQSSKSIECISSKCSTSCHNDQDGMSDTNTRWRFLPTDLDAKHKKYSDSHPHNGFNDNHGHSLSETTALIPQTEQAVIPDVKAKSTDASQWDGENASQLFGLGNRFVVNGFERNVSLVHDEKSEDCEPLCSRKTDFCEQKSRSQSIVCQTFSEKTFKGYFGSGSPIDSPSSSPPLQHMKIYFQPINGFETSKLKLKFPDGIYCQDSSRDMLPSFQLVPDIVTPPKDISSDTDDDTFCRSSPYLSDDCLSHHSGSNSEQWESDDTPTSKDNELYDALCRISLTESVSSSLEPEGTGRGSIRVDHDLQTPFVENCLELCHSGRSLELPSLSTVNPLFEQEMKNGSDAKDLPESHFPKEPTPLPPPLPPLEWLVMKPHSDMVISKQDPVSEALNHAFDMATLRSSISPQSKPNPVKQQQNIDEAVAFTQKIKPKWQKPEGQKEVNKAINGRGIDEKEDFLHQIRTKSFSLRRTMPEKPTVTPGPMANVKVTAILEKANAIRQAFGSDDGEDDDNWSDT